MSAARRRPLHRDNLDIETTLRHLHALAPQIELGWSTLRHDMTDAGWTATTPDGDRKLATPQLSIRCRECDETMQGSYAKDAHSATTGHDLYQYIPTATTGGSTLTHTDTTGTLALTLDHMSDDLLQLQDLWDRASKALAHMVMISRRYIPEATPATPACAVETCDGIVEQTPGGYRGMDQIAGHWVAKPGSRPVCAAHRSVGRRLAS